MSFSRPVARGLLVITLVAAVASGTAPLVTATNPARNGPIAFQAETDSGVQLFVVRHNGHGLRQITHVDGSATLPDWSPDGERIAFAYNECSIALVDPSGANLHVVAADEGLCQTDPSFTPDGERLVYTRFDFALEVEEIWSMRVDGSDQRPMTSAGGVDPNMSPDGTMLSYKGPPVGALFVERLEGSEPLQVSPSVSVTYKHDWAPDGTHLVVSDNSDPSPNDAVNILTVRPDGSDLEYVTHYSAPLQANVGGYSPDGKWIVFRLQGGGLVPAMYRIRPDGTGLHRLFQSDTIVPRFIDWGPANDGSSHPE